MIDKGGHPGYSRLKKLGRAAGGIILADTAAAAVPDDALTTTTKRRKRRRRKAAAAAASTTTTTTTAKVGGIRKRGRKKTNHSAFTSTYPLPLPSPSPSPLFSTYSPILLFPSRFTCNREPHLARVSVEITCRVG